MKKYIIFTLFVATLMFQSCDKFLGIQPKGYTIPSSYDDYTRIMNYAQLFKASYHTAPFITDDALFADGNINANFTALPDNTRYLYTFAHGPIYNDGESDPLWQYCYSRIYSFNVVANNAVNSAGGTLEKRKTLRAEALVGRAYELLTLIAAYAPAYDPATAATDYGVPIILTEDIGDMNYRRNTVAEVYERIKEDLDEASLNLLDVVPHSFRPAKSVAYGLLARMYLLMGDYDNALKNAKLSTEINNDLVDLKLYGIKSPTTGIGRIVLASDLVTSYPEGRNNPENIYARYPPSVFANNVGVYASQSLLDVFKKDLAPESEDMRRTLYFCDNRFSSTQFEGYTAWCPYIRLNVGLNTMDIMLIAAECYARKGDASSLTEAAKIYNRLRDNRIKNNVHIAFANSEDGIRKIIDERRREFAMITIYRLSDLKRLNKDPRFAITVTHTAEGQTWTLPPNDNRYIFPLPPTVKDLRPDLPDYVR